MEKLESVPALVVGLRRGPHAFLILNSDRFLLLSNLPDTFPPVTVRLAVSLVGDGGGFPEAQARQVIRGHGDPDLTMPSSAAPGKWPKKLSRTCAS